MLSPIKKTFQGKKSSPWEVFFRLYAEHTHCFFLDSCTYLPPNQRHSHIGMDPFVEVRLRKNHMYVISGKSEKKYPADQLVKVVRKLMKKYESRFPKAAPFCAGIYGYLGYECVNQFENIRLSKKKGLSEDDMWLGFFHRLLIFDHKTNTFTAVAQPLDNTPKEKRKAKDFIKEMQLKIDSNEDVELRYGATGIKGEITKSEFKNIVKKAKEYICAGDIYQANLSQKFHFRFKGSALGLYGQLRKINPSPFSSFFKIGDLEVVSSSPERLVKNERDRVETRPIAGTCRKDQSTDLKKWKKKLLDSEKERAEHLMLVDLERNDLGRVCDFKSVKVEEFMVLEKYSHVVHLVSKVVGKLRKDQDAWDLIRAVFPGGTITGCPKVRCMEIIDELELSRRNLYTGSLGRIDFNGDMDLNIIIRTLMIRKNKGSFQVGAGIVYDSDPEKEYQETLHKAKALIKALKKRS